SMPRPRSVSAICSADRCCGAASSSSAICRRCAVARMPQAANREGISAARLACPPPWPWLFSLLPMAPLLPQRAGPGKNHVFRLPVGLGRRRTAPFAQPLDHLLHELLGRRRSSRNADRFDAVEPLALEIAGAVDQVARHAGAIREFAKPVGIRTAAG